MFDLMVYFYGTQAIADRACYFNKSIRTILLHSTVKVSVNWPSFRVWDAVEQYLGVVVCRMMARRWKAPLPPTAPGQRPAFFTWFIAIGKKEIPCNRHSPTIAHVT